MLNDALIIATKDRPETLRLCLASVVGQDRPPGLIMVVDSSVPDDTEMVARSFDVQYLRSGPGLAKQRNAGLQALPTSVDIVHFIDDDVVLEPGYFAAVAAVFDDPSVAGAGGVMTNVPAGEGRFVDRIFFLDSQEPGTLLASGRNILASGLVRSSDVDWLSGCSMSFRRQALSAQPFDERIGYDEDVEISLEVATHGRLVVTPRARLEHRQAPINRFSRDGLTSQYIVLRYRRVRRHIDRFSRLAFWWSGLGEIALAIWGLRSDPSASMNHLRAVLRGYHAVLRPAARSRLEIDPMLPEAAAVQASPETHR